MSPKSRCGQQPPLSGWALLIQERRSTRPVCTCIASTAAHGLYRVKIGCVRLRTRTLARGSLIIGMDFTQPAPAFNLFIGLPGKVCSMYITITAGSRHGSLC
jgi:hypothetical protein